MAKLVPKMAKGGVAGMFDRLYAKQMRVAKSYWNKFDKKQRIDFLSYWNKYEKKQGIIFLTSGYSKTKVNNLSVKKWDSLDEDVQNELRGAISAGYIPKDDKMAKGGTLVAEEVEITAEEFVRNLKSKGIKATKRTSKNGVFIYGENNGNGGYKYETFFGFSEVPDVKMLELEEFQFLKSHNKMAKGGTFDDKVKAISKKLVGKPVPAPYRKEYGSRYDKEDAQEAARRIVGNMRKLYGE